MNDRVETLAQPRTVSGRAAMVRLYEDRAEVVRRAAVELSSGPQWIAVSGVTALIDDRSVQAEIRADGARVVSARVLRRVHPQGVDGLQVVENLQQRAEQLLDDLRRAERAEQRAGTALARVDRALADWLAGLARVPALTDEAVQKRWMAAYRALEEAEQAAFSESRVGLHGQEDVRRTAGALYAKLMALRTERPRIDAVVEVQLTAERPGPAELEIRYRTPCAVWRPEHHARLIQREGTRIELTTYATVWQATGEDWTDVEVELSTARPAQASSAPLLEEDRIASRKKSEEERRTIVVEQREQVIQVAGVNDAARAVDEMPGVDDGGEPVSYRPTGGRATLPSTGRPYRLEIGRMTLEAAAGRILVPERAPVAHLRATATLTSGGPLLAGPVRITRNGSAMGRSKTDFVGKGEPFEFGFGPDDAVRARRKVTEARDRTPVIGTQKIERTVRLFLSNLSEATKEVTVLERMPVSEIDEIEILLTEGAPDWTHNRQDGFLRRKVLLGARETKEIRLGYEIRAKSNVALPF